MQTSEDKLIDEGVQVELEHIGVGELLQDRLHCGHGQQTRLVNLPPVQVVALAQLLGKLHVTLDSFADRIGCFFFEIGRNVLKVLVQ